MRDKLRRLAFLLSAIMLARAICVIAYATLHGCLLGVTIALLVGPMASEWMEDGPSPLLYARLTIALAVYATLHGQLHEWWFCRLPWIRAAVRRYLVGAPDT